MYPSTLPVAFGSYRAEKLYISSSSTTETEIEWLKSLNFAQNRNVPKATMLNAAKSTLVFILIQLTMFVL